jgi:hypothetical protein
MISRADYNGAIEKAQTLVDQVKETQAEILKKGKGVSCRIENTWYSRPYWKGTQEEFEAHIRKKYYE